MIRSFWQRLSIVLLLLWAPVVHASDQAKKLASGVALLDKWQPDQHLYTVGDLSLSERELNGLEKWLDQNGKNWTILLTQSSSKERYKGPFGDRLTGVDAVETALTRGLRAKTAFGQLKDQKSGLANGALFIIYLKERQFSYYGATYYSRNGADPSRFKNNLDAEARKAMRDGGKIIQAVTRTIASIDGRVVDTIAQRERKREKLAQAAKDDLSSLKAKLNTTSEKQATIVAEIPEGGGDFTRFPGAKYREQLKALESNPGIHSTARIHRDLDQWDQRFEDYRKDKDEFEKIEKALSQSKPKSKEGKALLKRAKTQIQEARKNYDEGHLIYKNQLIKGQTLNNSIDSADRAARRAAKRRSDSLKVGGATTAGGLCLIGVIGNRRRRRIKAEAEKLLASRKQEMKETEDRLFELMDRAAIIVGPINELDSRGYTGNTLDLSKEALKNIDEAFVLSSNVQKIIEEGEELIEPSSPLSRSRNIVSGGRYESAVDLLDAELNVGLQNVPDLKKRARPGEEADETFSVPIDEWGARTTKALDEAEKCLDRVENAWSTIIERRETLSANIDTLIARQDETQVDQWLRCELLFDEWIPAMSELESRASKIGKSDPVHALDGDMAKADRMAEEAKTQLDLISQFRKDHWLKLAKDEEILDQRKRATRWIDQGLAELSQKADDIATHSPKGDVSTSIDGLGSDLIALTQQVDHAAQLIVRADEIALPEINETTQLVSKARREIASSLRLDPDDILTEEDHNPSHFLAKASQQHEASLAALDLGETKSAEGSLNETDALTAHACDLVDRTRHCLSHYQATSEALTQRRERLEESGQQLKNEVTAMRQRYAPRALFLDPNSPELGTLADSPTHLDKSYHAIGALLDTAKTRFHSGGLLQSWDYLLDGQASAEDGEFLCSDVTSRFKTLTAMEKKNIERHLSQVRAEADLDEPVRDRRVTMETIKLHELISQKLSEGAREIEAGDGLRDPYLVEEILDDLGERIPILRKAITEDIEQNKRALQLFDTVKRNQKEAGILWETAENDQIPNSPKTNESMDRIELCHGKLQDAHAALQVNHADWREIQNELRAIHLTLSEAVIDLQRELELARQTVRALESATREVRKAARWSGSYGVRITGSYGGRSLATANDVMQHGRYHEALQMAGQAKARARSAIAQAEAREAAKRRAAAAARRRQQQAASRAAFHNSRRGGISTRSSFSSSSRSMSSGRSSFSSGSGAGRSGW